MRGSRPGGDKWHPDTWEQWPPPFKALQAFACRNVGTNSTLLARIDYEKQTVTNADRNTVRQILDNVGDAVDDKLRKQPAAPAPANPYSLDTTVLSENRGGFDLAPYLSTIISRVRNNWYAAMPQIARLGRQGRVVVGFTIARDGTVHDVRAMVSAEDTPLTNAAQAAIQSSSPFPVIPEGFKGEEILLSMSFVYNPAPAGAR